MSNTDAYIDFLKSKMAVAENAGFEIDQTDILNWHKPHVKDIVQWAIKGGRRAICGSFGLAKTATQLEICRQILKREGGNALITCPLAVQNEFFKDAAKMGLEYPITYIKDNTPFEGKKDVQGQIFITNNERIRTGNIDFSKFTVICSDEASFLRSLDTATTQIFMEQVRPQIKYRFVATATPAPNRLLELVNYAHYLGIMDRGQILTRFFQRDSTKANNLTLYPKREHEFWLWVFSWMVVPTRPSDMGHSDEGYDLPEADIRWHKVSVKDRPAQVEKDGRVKLISEVSAGVGAEKSREDKLSLQPRIDKMMEIIKDGEDNTFPTPNFLIWHYREDERREIQKRLGKQCKSVWGNQDLEEREDHLSGFADGTYQILSTKPEIAGSGCNFQYHCYWAIYVGLTDNFNDFIQSIHRILRFGQSQRVRIDIIYTDAQEAMRTRLEKKWKQHEKTQHIMTKLLRKYGLHGDVYSGLTRQFFENRQSVAGRLFEAINNDNTLELPRMKDNSAGLILTSIPFGNHYEYSENYNCAGHNPTNESFFRQMDFLTPELFRVLQPGRIAAIHVKDRIRYSYQNNAGFTTIDDFSGDTVRHFKTHGFHLMAKITITTDVVRENNQTYRLGHTEHNKDATKMGAGLPEYVLLFRKPTSDNSNAYADLSVEHSKEDYTLGRWQIDAHAYWKSNGHRLFDTEALKRMELKEIVKLWDAYQIAEGYDYSQHVALNDALAKLDKLPKTFFAMQPISLTDLVWTDINRMNTLNSSQARKNQEKHICPLQLDICERIIERLSNPGEVVLDPYGGIMSVPYTAVKLKRYGIGIELNKQSWRDGVKHLQEISIEDNRLSLFESITEDNYNQKQAV